MYIEVFSGEMPSTSTGSFYMNQQKQIDKANVAKCWEFGEESPDIPLEKEMATHSSVLTWKIPWTEEPGGP